MSEMVYMYGFGFGGPPGRNVTVHVTYGGATGSGANVSCTNGKKTFYGVTDTNGNFAFKLAKGRWTITANKSGSTSSVNVDITGDCTVNVSLFAATIKVTYPAGSTCTVTDGTTTLTAPGAGGTWKCVVNKPGTWTVTLDRGYSEKIEVTESGEYTVNKWHLYNSGDQCIGITGGWSSDIRNGANYWAYNDDCMSCSMGSISDGGSRTLTNRNINFSGFKTAYVQFSFDGSQFGIYARIGPGVLDTRLSDYPVKTVNSAPIDLSAVQSTRAFDIVIYPNTSNVKVFNVWLEV